MIYAILTIHIGTTVRIRPYEVHIDDPAFGDTFFGSGTERMDKYAGHRDQFWYARIYI